MCTGRSGQSARQNHQEAGSTGHPPEPAPRQKDYSTLPPRQEPMAALLCRGQSLTRTDKDHQPASMFSTLRLDKCEIQSVTQQTQLP